MQVHGSPWVKFLLLRLLTMHGSEPIFALNEFAVLGKSAAEDLEDRLAADGDENDEPPPLLPTGEASPASQVASPGACASLSRAATRAQSSVVHLPRLSRADTPFATEPVQWTRAEW